jgi:FMN phosphatase YigB (HAD superfamily)
MVYNNNLISFISLYLFLIIFTVFATMPLQALIIYPEHEVVRQPGVKPNIIFDADDVLENRNGQKPLNIAKFSLHLAKDSTQRLALVKSVPNIIEVKTEEQYNPLKLYAASKRFGAKIKSEIEEFDLDPVIDALVAKHSVLRQKTNSNVSFAEQIKEYASRGIPRKGPIHLLQKLHDEGYPIAIATNQGYKTFKRLMDAKTVPSSDHYILIYTCDYGNPNPTLESKFIKKPSKEYFIDLKKRLDEKGLGNRPKVFVDDRKENVEAAAQEGIIGVGFSKLFCWF